MSVKSITIGDKTTKLGGRESGVELLRILLMLVIVAHQQKPQHL